MKNTNKNMLYTFWSGAILLCLALVAVVLVFTNAVGNTHTSKPKDDPAAAPDGNTPETDAPETDQSDHADPVVRRARADGGQGQHLRRPDLFSG